MRLQQKQIGGGEILPKLIRVVLTTNVDNREFFKSKLTFLKFLVQDCSLTLNFSHRRLEEDQLFPLNTHISYFHDFFYVVDIILYVFKILKYHGNSSEKSLSFQVSLG